MTTDYFFCTFNSLRCVVVARCKQWETAVSLLREMTRGPTAPDIVSYGAAITACAGCKQGDAAVGLLREMPVVGITPDSQSYTSAISACGRSGDWERAVGLFREISLLRVGFRPDAVSYSAAIAACGDGGQWEKALRYNVNRCASCWVLGSTQVLESMYVCMYAVVFFVGCM